jgi:two-component system, NtrC family, sensor kinase
MKALSILRLVFALLLALGVATLGGLSVHRKVQTFQPLGFAAQVEGGAVRVLAVEAPATGLAAGDRILLANAREVGADLGERLRERPESRLTVLRGEELVEVSYQRPPLDLDLPFLILALIGAGYLLIGLFTLLRHGGTQGFLFYLWCLASAAFYLITPTPAMGAPDLLYRAFYLADELARILLPALTLHLFLVFPAPLVGARWSARRAVPFLYLPAAALLALQADLALTGGRWIFGGFSEARVWALDRVELAHLAAFALAAVGVVGWRLARGRDWEQRRQMQWIAFGLAGGYLPFLLFYALPFTLGLRGPELLTTFSVLPLALVPVAFAYAILRYKLWDIEVIVRDIVSSTLTLLFGVIGFSLVNLAINRGISQELAGARNLLSFAAGLAIAGLLVPTRHGISSALERLHYRDTFGKRKALRGFGRELLLERDLRRLCSALIERIEEAVGVTRVNLYLAQSHGLAPVFPEESLPVPLPADALGEGFWDEDSRRLSALALPGEVPAPARGLFAAGYRYVFPLIVRGRGVGVALTGAKEGQMPLNSEDLELIRQLLDQAALAIENAQLVAQLHVQLEEVQRLQNYSEGIFESSPAGIAVLAPDGRLLSVNAAFGALAERPRGELLGRPLAEALPVSPLPTCGSGPVEVSYSDPAGRERHLQLSLAAFDPLHRGDGLQVLVVHDVSERVAMENALKEKDRLAALGMLAAGVAHEVNTPITGISSYAQMLLSETPPTDPHYEILKKVERQTFRAARIVNNLLEFARNRQKERRTVDLAPILTECLDLLGDRLGKNRIELDWTPPAEPALVLGCDGELQQVFTNLILNALDAMSGTGGRLTLRIAADGARVRAEVCDTGPGIPPDKLEMIFQPFYSTKLNRGGTGLGLSISFDIVRRHGGDLRATSRPGEGSCFVVELPRFRADSSDARSEIN